MEDFFDYDKAALIKRLRYADCTLRNPNRKPTPLHMHALEIYKDACISLLEIEDRERGVLGDASEEEIENIKIKWVVMLVSYEQRRGELRGLDLAETDEQELQDKLLELKKASFYARYGDIL